MRIAILGSRGYPSTYSGYETLVRELVPRMLEWGHEPIVYCRTGPANERAWDVGGAECRRTPGIARQRISTLSFGLTSALDVRGRDVDAALVVNCANGYWLPLLSAAGVPAALNVDGLEWERGKWNRLGRAVFTGGAAVAARAATRLVADSRAIAAVWERRFDVRPDYIPYGAELIDDDAADELAPLGLEPGGYVLTVARLVPENNLELAVEALGLLGDGERPTHVIAGSAPAGSPLDAYVRELAVRDRRVRWLGHVANQRLLAQLYRHCLVYVHGHSVGGTNPSLLQALGAGAPALAFDVPFNREVIGDRDDVYFRTAADLADRLRAVIASEDLRGELGEHGRAQVRDRYRWPDVCRRYVDLLAELAGAGHAPAEAVR